MKLHLVSTTGYGESSHFLVLSEDHAAAALLAAGAFESLQLVEELAVAELPEFDPCDRSARVIGPARGPGVWRLFTKDRTAQMWLQSRASGPTDPEKLAMAWAKLPADGNHPDFPRSEWMRTGADASLNYAAWLAGMLVIASSAATSRPARAPDPSAARLWIVDAALPYEGGDGIVVHAPGEDVALRVALRHCREVLYDADVEIILRAVPTSWTERDAAPGLLCADTRGILAAPEDPSSLML